MPSTAFFESLESRRFLSGTTLPTVFSVDPASLAAAKSQIAAGGKTLKPAYNALISAANNDLSFSPQPVTSKSNPTGISAHDYVSYARYYWPNPNTKSGLPYISRDGQVNQAQVDKGDDGDWGSMVTAVDNLAMAYYFSGNVAYAQKAASILEIWFLNPATAMNPNLNHSQIELGIDNGTFYGIIDTREMYEIVDALGLIGNSGAWSKTDRNAMDAWLTQFNSWLETSSFGKSEDAATNNHGTWFDVQHTAILLYLGKTSEAKSIAQEFETKRIAPEIRSDGSQPLELARADGWAYSNFNLQAMELMADLASRVGVNLWSYQASSGGSIQKALNYLVPYANSNVAWPHNHLSGQPLTQGDRDQLIPEILAAQPAYGPYSRWLSDLPASTVAADEEQLFTDE